MSEPQTVPDAAVVGIVASRAWEDWSAVTRVTTALLTRGTDLRLGGCQALQDQTMFVALSLLELEEFEVRCRAYSASGPAANALERDERLLTDLVAAGAHLVAFLALDAKGRTGRTHALVDEARRRGIPVTVIQPGPDTEPAGGRLAETAERAVDHVDRAEQAFRSVSPARFALYRVAVAAAERLAPELESVERRLEGQWAWLDANPLVVDFAVREHKTLNLLATYGLLQRVREGAACLVRDHAHESTWSPAFGGSVVAS